MTPAPPTAEDLLAHISWMKPLARRLLSDDAGADDVVQETCLVFLRRPPRSVEASGVWLSRVVRNLVMRSRQARERRENRERRAARPERICLTPDQVIEQAEMHRLLVEEVIHMDEPYRSTVLLRFFGEQTPAEIARQQEVSLDTVKTRLRRAIEHLRRRLDRVYGDREAWTLAILSLAGGMGALSSAPAAASTATACVAGLGSTGGTSSAAAVTGISLGGFIVTQKTAVAMGLIGIITLAGGFGLGHFTSMPNAEDTKARLGLVEKAEATLNDIAKLKAENKKLAAAKASLEEERTELERKTSELGEKVTELEAMATPIEKRATRRGPRLAFHDMGELEEDLFGANWREMAEATATMTSMLKEMAQSDTEPTQDQLIELRLEEQKLMSVALKTMNKLPSHMDDGNGGFTHPIIYWNLLAERLEVAGLPLSEAQVARMSRLGVEYDADWERQDAAYTADSLAFEKVMNELELKRTYNERLLGLLTHEQREVIVDPVFHDTYPYDLYSPLLLLAGKVEPLAKSTKDEVRKSIEKVFSERYGLSEEETRASAAAFDAWLVQVEPLLATPLASLALHRLYFLSGVEAIAAGRAQAILMKEVMVLLPPDAPSRGKMLSSIKLYLPRLVEKK